MIEERILGVVAQLVSQGYSVRDLLDFDNGVTPAQLFALQVHAARISILEREMQVHGTIVAITSLFKPSLASQFFQELKSQSDELATALESSQPSPTVGHPDASPKRKSPGKKSYTVGDVQKSLKNLEKLRQILN